MTLMHMHMHIRLGALQGTRAVATSSRTKDTSPARVKMSGWLVATWYVLQDAGMVSSAPEHTPEMQHRLTFRPGVYLYPIRVLVAPLNVQCTREEGTLPCSV